ncbi:MAG: hypothetical protein AAF721_26320 [Myxococcota bacterium]
MRRGVAELFRRPAETAEAWRAGLAHDVAQSQRNVGDYRDVLARRQRRASRAVDTQRRAAELLGLAEIRSFADVPHSVEHLTALLAIGSLPAGLVPTLRDLLIRLADAPAAPPPSLFTEALELMPGVGRRRSRARVYAKIAWLHHCARDTDAAIRCCEAGLSELGWVSRVTDPFRDRLRDVPEIEPRARETTIELASLLSAARARRSGLDAATGLLDDLRGRLGGAILPHQAEMLALSEANAHFEAGCFEHAERCYGDIHDRVCALGLGETSAVIPSLTGLAACFIELDLGGEASGAAKRVLSLECEPLTGGVARAREFCEYVIADCTRRKGELDAADRLAKTLVAQAHDPLVRASATRVAAEIALERDDVPTALELAKRAVAVACDLVGDDACIAPELSILARAQAVGDLAAAEASYRRAASLSYPPGHPHAQRAARELASHLERQDYSP